MFAFHETTRKRICRTGFFALCLAPTCATAAWIVDHHLPWRQSAAARRLSDRYHLQVQLADYREPRPNFLRTASATLTAPDAAAPLLKLTGIETHRGETLALSIDELALSVADLPALAEQLESSFQRTAARRIDLLVKQVTLTAPVITQLHQLQATIERDAAGNLGFRLIAHTTATPSADAKPLRLSLEPRAASDGVPEHAAVTLDTQQNGLPASLLAPLVPGVAALNDTATFTGSVEWKSSHPLGSLTTPAWEGDLKGQFTGVDLARLIPQTSSHKLQGTATLELTECHWRDARFTHLAGTLVAAPNARLNGAFLFAARKYLVCRISSAQPALQAAAERYAYAHLHQPEVLQQHAAADAALAEEFHLLDLFACQFKLDADGLVIAPRPSEETSTADATGAIAVAGSHPLLLAALDAKAAGQSGDFTPVTLPAASWLQFMANSTSHWLPFTPEAVETARRLPSPQVAVPK